MKILLVTGSSGGHIFPAFSFIDTLREKHENIETLLILARSHTAVRIEKSNYKVGYICVSPIQLKLELKNLIAIFNFLKAALESMVILLNYKPDIVVGFGSLASVPMVIFAWLFRIKTFIHEQNVIPGRANRLLAIFSDRIAISFAQTRDYFRKYERKVVLTGNPIRRQLVRIDKSKALEFFGFHDDKFTILVMGGSQGSRRINLEFLRAISVIPDKLSFQIIHLTGSQDSVLLQASYKNAGVNIRVLSFCEQMQYSYSACDLVISRGGATTIAEIMFFSLAAIIIPYPFAYRHQIANAKVLERKGCAVIVKDDELNADILRKHIEGFTGNPELLKSMRSCYNGFAKIDTHTLFVDSVLSLS